MAVVSAKGSMFCVLIFRATLLVRGWRDFSSPRATARACAAIFSDQRLPRLYLFFQAYVDQVLQLATIFSCSRSEAWANYRRNELRTAASIARAVVRQQQEPLDKKPRIDACAD